MLCYQSMTLMMLLSTLLTTWRSTGGQADLTRPQGNMTQYYAHQLHLVRYNTLCANYPISGGFMIGLNWLSFSKVLRFISVCFFSKKVADYDISL